MGCQRGHLFSAIGNSGNLLPRRKILSGEVVLSRALADELVANLQHWQNLVDAFVTDGISCRKNARAPCGAA